jgi:aerobic C4-dicarboxylate transport protein
VQVLIAIALGVALGHFWPAVAVEMKPFGDGFIKLIKMVIALVIFCTVVSGIAGMDDMKKVGRVGGKALLILKWSRPLPSPLASLSRTLFSLGRD